jgi:lipoprotein-anchoring transpeptidase ErfK/SrfK
VKVVTVGMRRTTSIARVDQEWKSRATGNIENKRYKTTTTPTPKKIQQQKTNTKLKK